MAELNCDIKSIETTIGNLRAAEISITNFRDQNKNLIHPWSKPSLANAIGSIQHAISDLKTAKHHIESPKPKADEEIVMVDPVMPLQLETIDAELVNPHCDIPSI